MFLSQRSELLIQFVMPWIQNEYLKAERRGADDEVCEREAARDQHGGQDCLGVDFARQRKEIDR
jgi:hypothetical protein